MTEEEIVAVLRLQHKAIDWLIARVALLDITFRPSQCVEVRDAFLAGDKAIKKLETGTEKAHG